MYVVKERSERYEKVETLSEGAMGSVVLARDRLMDRFVAVKTVKMAGVENPVERERLQDALRTEAQVIQLLSHPNIVSVHEVIDEPGSEGPSLVMEYVQGSTLEAFLKGGKPLPSDFTLSIAVQVARALEHAHAMGVIHGDIKPGNILISDDGEQAKIADFGIAKMMTEIGDPQHRLYGTPRYVSPEQILGQKADQRSDLFSLGVVLYEMLTGRSPFAGQTSREITNEIARGGADLSAEALQDVPEPLRAVLGRALERDPANRFQSARQMAESIENPQQESAETDTVATQDLSELVVPEIPDLDSLEVLTDSAAPPVPPTKWKEKSPATATRYSAGKEPPLWPRLAIFGGLAAILTLTIGLTAIWFATPSGPPDGHFSPEHLVRAEVLPLFQEGRRQMLEGQPEVAIRLFRRAQGIVPTSSDVARALQRAEKEAIEQQASQKKSEELGALLTESREALDSGKPQQALRQATQALAMDPDSFEARTLIDAAESQRFRPPANPSPQKKSPPSTSAREPQPRVVQPQPQTPSPEWTNPARSIPPPQVRSRAAANEGPTSATADLRVDVFSYLSKGVLTVYADQDQVLLQPFRFVQKAGFMRKKKTAGRLETSVVLPSGPTEFRIYISTEGQETQTVNLAADLAGGQTHTLRLIIAENGSASAQVN
jgi:serine/threonine protein kinase